MLKYWYEKESDVPADKKDLYEEKELSTKPGEAAAKRWVLKVEGVILKEIHAEFRENNRLLKSENDSLKEKLTGIDDPERARALLKVAKDVELDDAEKYLKKGGVDAMIQERVKATKEDMDKKLTDEKTARAKAEQALDREVINNTFLGACSKLSLQPGAETMILRQVEGQWVRKDGKIVLLDANGTPRSNKDGSGDLGPTEWLQETLLKQHPYLVKESSGAGASGGGSSGTGGQSNTNPFKKETWNLTEQMKLVKSDPAKAARLQQAAKTGG
jgi:hypothetical protein